MIAALKHGLAALVVAIALGGMTEAKAQGFGFGFSNFSGYGFGGTGVSIGVGVGPGFVGYGGYYPGYYAVPGYAGLYGAPVVAPYAVAPAWGPYDAYRPAFVGGFTTYAYPRAYVYRPW